MITRAPDHPGNINALSEVLALDDKTTPDTIRKVQDTRDQASRLIHALYGQHGLTLQATHQVMQAPGMPPLPLAPGGLDVDNDTGPTRSMNHSIYGAFRATPDPRLTRANATHKRPGPKTTVNESAGKVGAGGDSPGKNSGTGRATRIRVHRVDFDTSGKARWSAVLGNDADVTVEELTAALNNALRVCGIQVAPDPLSVAITTLRPGRPSSVVEGTATIVGIEVAK